MAPEGLWFCAKLWKTEKSAKIKKNTEFFVLGLLSFRISLGNLYLKNLPYTLYPKWLLGNICK